MHSDPKTKEQFLDRVLSFDFDGDFTDLGRERGQIRRTGPHRFMVRYPTSGQHFEVVIRKPRITKRPRRVNPRREPETLAKDANRRNIRNRLTIRA